MRGRHRGGEEATAMISRLRQETRMLHGDTDVMPELVEYVAFWARMDQLGAESVGLADVEDDGPCDYCEGPQQAANVVITGRDDDGRDMQVTCCMGCAAELIRRTHEPRVEVCTR